MKFSTKICPPATVFIDIHPSALPRDQDKNPGWNGAELAQGSSY
jgi:hypothetical protein